MNEAEEDNFLVKEDEVDFYVEDDGGPQLIAIDQHPSGTQALWVRVGPIYHGNKIEDEPGVWIEYQTKYLGSRLEGPVLLPAHVWDELDKAVRSRINKFDKSNYGTP